MKILHVIDSGGLYGAEIMLLNLVDEQIKLGLKPTICSIGNLHIKEKPLETEALKRGLQIEGFRMRSGPNICGAWRILKYAQKEGFDLIHSHGYKGNILLGYLPKKIRKISLITTLHGWTNTRFFSKMKIYEWLEVSSLKHLDAVVLVNKGMCLNKRMRGYKTANLSIINNGIPISIIHTHKQNIFTNLHGAIDKDVLSFSRQGFIIGSIGRLSAEKGFSYLIEAINILLKKNIDSKLVIIGEGPERTNLEKQIRAFNIAERVLLPGYKDHASRYLSLFNVFVLPSLTEGMPITILEAMLAKTPIIATKVGGIPEILQDKQGGLLVEPKKTEAIAEAIWKIYYGPELSEQLVSFSYKEVITKYSCNDMALKYSELYRRVVNSSVNIT